MNKQKRGELSRRVDYKAKQVLGRSITLPELRLMPYVHYVTMNEQVIGRGKINDEEEALLDKWQAEGLLKRTSSRGVKVTKKFYAAMCEILWLSYCDLAEEK